MSTAIAAEHHHKFKVRYKLVEGERILIDPVCKCAGCAVQAHIKFDGYRIMVTFVGDGSDISYTAVLAEG